MTSLPSELPLLSAVVSNPVDDDLKLAYADWLEEHCDPRGAFLRQFVQAVRSGERLPSGSGVPSAWEEIVGISLLRRLCEDGAATHRATAMALAKPAVAMQTKVSSEDRIAIGGTKFGGRPDLPATAEWPRCDRGPMEFHAQLELAEFRKTFAGQALPPDGLLSFFMYHNYPEDEYGNGRGQRVKHTGGLRVIYTGERSTLARLDPLDDLNEDLGRPRSTCQVTYTEVLDVPDPDDTWSERYGAASACVGEIQNYDSDPLRRATHQMFGHARIIALCQDPIPGPEWPQLIRFGSDDRLGWNWGDGHRLFWYIKTADLKRGNFEHTWATDG